MDKLLTAIKLEESKQCDEHAMKLAAELYMGRPCERWLGNQWTDRGHRLEQDAMNWYAEVMGEMVDRTIAFISGGDGFGFSPDGLIWKGAEGVDGSFLERLIEVKCLSDPKHAAAFLDPQGTIKRYNLQVQSQMTFCHANDCDLVFYHPELPSFIHNIERDEDASDKISLATFKCIERRDTYLDKLNKQTGVRITFDE